MHCVAPLPLPELCSAPLPPSSPYFFSRQLRFSQLHLTGMPFLSLSCLFSLCLSLPQSLWRQINTSHVSSSATLSAYLDTAQSGLCGNLRRTVIGCGRETAASGAASGGQAERDKIAGRPASCCPCGVRTECLAGGWTCQCETFHWNTRYICFACSLSPHVEYSQSPDDIYDNIL